MNGSRHVKQVFRREDLLRVALQSRGGSTEAVTAFFKRLRESRPDVALYDKWNRFLTPKEMTLLKLMLQPKGDAYNALLLDKMMPSLAAELGIPLTELWSWLNQN